MSNNENQNIMGTMPVGKLVMKISIPLMVSMVVQALYNIVDSIFVAMVSETALTAVSLAFPIQNLLIAFAIGTSVGVNSYLARKLGEKNTAAAVATAGNGLFLAVCTWAVFALVLGTGSKAFLSLYTDHAELLKEATDYSRIVSIFSLGLFMDIMIERILQGTGDSFHPMLTQLTGAITNIILDPVFIFVFGFGVRGAAIATVIGQFVSMLLAIYFVRKNPYIKLKIRKIRPQGAIIKEIYNVGVPTIITNAIGTVMVSLMNSILIAFSTTAVSVFGVYFKLQSFVFMPVFGLNAGLIAILAFNYGARNKKRMIDTMGFGIKIALFIMIIGLLIFIFLPRPLLALFSATDEMYAIGIPALKAIAIHFPIAAFCIVFMSLFQATGFGVASMIVSITRQLVVLIPAAYILGRLFGLGAVWYSFIIAELVSFAISFFFVILINKKRLNHLDDSSIEESSLSLAD